MTPNEFKQLDSKIKKAEADVNRLQGTREHYLGVLNEMGCKNVKEAKQALKDEREEYENLQQELEAAVEHFKEEYEL